MKKEKSENGQEWQKIVRAAGARLFTFIKTYKKFLLLFFWFVMYSYFWISFHNMDYCQNIMNINDMFDLHLLESNLMGTIEPAVCYMTGAVGMLIVGCFFILVSLIFMIERLFMEK